MKRGVLETIKIGARFDRPDLPRPGGLAGKVVDAARARQKVEAAFPKRCKTGEGDAFNMDCLWCGAPLGGKCQDKDQSN